MSLRKSFCLMSSQEVFPVPLDLNLHLDCFKAAFWLSYYLKNSFKSLKLHHDGLSSSPCPWSFRCRRCAFLLRTMRPEKCVSDLLSLNAGEIVSLFRRDLNCGKSFPVFQAKQDTVSVWGDTAVCVSIHTLRIVHKYAWQTGTISACSSPMTWKRNRTGRNTNSQTHQSGKPTCDKAGRCVCTGMCVCTHHMNSRWNS